MAAHGPQAAALALHRFGLGPRRNSIAAIASDPRGALAAELDDPGAGRISAQLPSSGESERAVFRFQAEQRAQKKLELRAEKLAEAGSGANLLNCKLPQSGEACIAPVVAGEAENPQRPHQPPLPRQLILDEAKARFDAASAADIGFVERLVWFWSNHFCISADKIPAMAGPYEREAIRPHALGRFADMLQAVESHPGMLYYLDNVESIGPDSTAGIDRDKGLNENLARETLELHTLGVRSGYTQTDVTNFAKVLTGWTWFPPSEPVHGGEFVFDPIQHQPGAQIVLGKAYAETGVQQGRAVLADLARHPATAHHIAQELAAHFVADEPPPALVAKLEKTFNASGGDLKEVAKALIAADEAWTPQRTKLKPPAEWITGVLRLTDGAPLVPIGLVMGAQAQLGAALWRPPAPNGYSDREAAWIDGVPHRLDLANQFANRLAAGVDPVEMLDSALGPLASAQTRDTVLRAESRVQALTLLVMSPEFLRS
ncbi:MAG TPA: DUF1800 family protein [Xanthobacteraceae bacterium]|nr:DUF1800 family protein [Xanthobacteraceae bacterium]